MKKYKLRLLYETGSHYTQKKEFNTHKHRTRHNTIEFFDDKNKLVFLAPANVTIVESISDITKDPIIDIVNEIGKE